MSGRDTPRSEAPLTGRCHCGNLELSLETSARPEELSLRADTCSFCRRHGARTTSDPSGRVVITVHHPDELLRYRFGLETADFLVCGRCGIYVAAVMNEGSSSYATVNVNILDAVGAPMRRRTGRSLPDPCPTAPNRSGDGAPAPVHGSLGSRS